MYFHFHPHSSLIPSLSIYSLVHTKYPGAIHHSLLSPPPPVSFPMFTSHFPLFFLRILLCIVPPTSGAPARLLWFPPDIVKQHLALYIYLVLYIPLTNTYLRDGFFRYRPVAKSQIFRHGSGLDHRKAPSSGSAKELPVFTRNRSTQRVHSWHIWAPPTL